MPVVYEYEYLIIDTPPNLGLLTVNAVVCADRILAPVSAEDEASLYGILELRQTIARLTERLGLQPTELVAVLTRWQRNRVSSRIAEAQLDAEGLAAGARIPARSAMVARAAARRVPLVTSEADSSPALAYRKLAERLEEVTAR